MNYIVELTQIPNIGIPEYIHVRVTDLKLLNDFGSDVLIVAVHGPDLSANNRKKNIVFLFLDDN